jgi:hypothetical protein
MKLWIRNASFLLVIGSALGVLGLFSRDLYRLLSLLSFLIFVSTFLPGLTARRDLRWLDIVSAVLIAALALFLWRFADLGLLHLYLAVSITLALFCWRSDSQEARQLASYVLALACVTIVAELVRLLPLVWHLRMGVASLLSAAGEAIAREDRNLGPTAMALPLLGALMILWLVRDGLAERRRRRRWLYGIILLAVTHIVYLFALKYYARWIGTLRGGDWFILNSQHVFLLLGSAVFTVADRGKPMRSLPRLFVRRLGTASIIALAAGFAAAFALGWAPPPPRGSATVMVFDAGYMNWAVPVHGKYGEKSAGMFGMLPGALDASGFDVVVSDDLTLLDGPDAPDCVVMINIQRFFEDEDKERIWAFVSKGGGLLCLGDHTGVAGIRGPFNDLLEPVGIRFEFDSSTFFGKGWNDALEFRVHPTNRVVRTDEDHQIWVGATLGVDAGARPVVLGRYGYSDIGDPANLVRAYLGDRRYNPDELLGDVVLVADAVYGEGKVMVFGDTSGYQNLSFARSLDTVASSLDYLAARGGYGRGTPAQIIGLAWILLAGLVCVAFARSLLPVLAIALGLGVGSAAAGLAAPVPEPITPVFAEKTTDFLLSPEPGRDWELAVLDASHGGHHTLRAWRDKSIGGLQLNLARNGYFLMIRDAFPYSDLEGGAKLFVVLAPARRYSAKEIDAVERFVRGGGRVIATVGFEELDASRDLLERFGMDVANIPLGRFEVPVEGDTLGVVFHEGWPVRFEPAAPVEVLLSMWDHPIAAKRTVGDGEIVLIGDSSFFHDVNLETLDSYFAGNVRFLREITEYGKETEQ